MATHLLRGHERFQDQFANRERQFLQGLATGQNPSTLFIGCSDSRVIPELLTSSKPGELFVVRNIANVVPRVDDDSGHSVAAAIEFAVNVLQVPHIVVCGHGDCGGVKAALKGLDTLENMPSLQRWLKQVEPAVTKAKVAQLQDDDERILYAIQENVLDQLYNLISHPSVHKGVDAGTLSLHAWVYDVSGALSVYDLPAREFISYRQTLDRDSGAHING